MKPKRKKKMIQVDFSNAPYNTGSYGSFFHYPLYKDSYKFYSCRESFFNRETNNYFGFYYGRLDRDRLIAWWKDLERRLKIKRKSKFFATSSGHAILIKRSSFWMKSDARKSLSTLFLRGAAVYYDGKGWWSAVKDYDLAREVYLAIKHFMRGRTVQNFEHIEDGFVDHFRHKDGESIKQLLLTEREAKKRGIGR